MMIQFDEVMDEGRRTGVYCAELRNQRIRTFRDSDISSCLQHLLLRIDTRKGPGRIEFRIAFAPQQHTWIAMHSDPGFASLAVAQEFAERWLAEAKRLQTLEPPMSRPDLGMLGRMASAVRENYRRTWV